MTSVKDFGARGDGQTDDTDSILHAVAQGGGQIVFPRGVYLITRPIDIEPGRVGRTSFSGELGVATLVMRGAGPAIGFRGQHQGTADPASFDPGVWAAERLPMVADLEILGEHSEAIGIEARGTMQLTVRGVLIRRCVQGIWLTGRNRNVSIVDCHIYHGRGAAIGIHFDAVNLHQAIVCGCHISYQAHAGIKVVGSEVRNLQITGNDIEYNHDPGAPDSADVWIDARWGTVREGTIASNTIQALESPGGSNVRIDGPERDDSAGAGLWTICGNILQSQEANLRLTACRGIAVSGNSFASGFARSMVLDRCRNVAVSGCTFDWNPDYEGDRRDGVYITGSAGCSFSGSILEGTRAGAPEGGGAIEVVASREIALTGLQVLDPAVRGMDLRDVRNCRVSDCSIVARGGAVATMLEGLRLTGDSSGNVIRSCLIGGAMRIEPATAAVVESISRPV